MASTPLLVAGGHVTTPTPHRLDALGAVLFDADVVPAAVAMAHALSPNRQDRVHVLAGAAVAQMILARTGLTAHVNEVDRLAGARRDAPVAFAARPDLAGALAGDLEAALLSSGGVPGWARCVLSGS